MAEKVFATHYGDLEIAHQKIPCAVLNNGKRVLIQREVVGLLTGNKKGGFDRYLMASNLRPFVPERLLGQSLDQSMNKILYKGKSAQAFDATDLIDLCEMYLKARNAGVLLKSQEKLALQAEIIIRSFAKVGIIAVIDEATGYQKQKNEYQKILELFIAKELQPYISTFENYYKQLYRLLGWSWDAFKNKKKNHPQYIGRLTNRLVYEKLAPGVLEELQKLNPKDDKGRRKHKNFQFLTSNHGYRELLRHIASISILMEQFPNEQLTEAISKIDARFPSYTPIYQTSMDFPVVSTEIFNNAIAKASLNVGN